MLLLIGLKLLLQGDFSFSATWSEIRPWIMFAYLITVLMFARANLYGERGQRGIVTNRSTSSAGSLLLARNQQAL